MSDTYSYSKLDTYQQCPFKFYLKYILEYNFYTDSIATLVGTLIHETEESIAKSIVANEPINYKELKNNIISNLYLLQAQFPKDYAEPDKSGRTYYEKIYSYLESGIYKLEQFMKDHPTYKIVGIEQAFNVEYLDKKFRGFIDRVFYDEATSHYIIQDIKTYAVEVEKEKLATPLQFVIYTLAAKKLYNCTNDQITCEYYLPFCDLTQAAGTAGYLDRGTNKLAKLFGQIAAENYEPAPSPLCNWCCFCLSSPEGTDESKYLCPYYCLWDRKTRLKSDIKKNENLWTGLENYQNVLDKHLAIHKR